MRLLLLHAFPLDPAMWEAQQPVLREHDVVAPTLYGRGSTMDAWASSILDEVDGPVIAIGASMGGGCALATARQRPDRILGIVLAGAHAGPDAPERRPHREETIETIRAQGPQAVWQGSGPAPSADELVAVVEALRDRPDDRAVVASLAVPLLVAVGDADPMVPVESARALADSASDGRVVVIEEAGHLVSLDQPASFNRTLADYLRDL